jgi:hypothetical protein
MDKNKLFKYIKHQKPSELIKLLDDCYSCMRARDIQSIFGHIENKFLKKAPNAKKNILNDVQKFLNDSLKGIYYAPFNINSKNFRDVPEETDMWFDKLGELLIASSQLSIQGDHINAVKCFGILFELINKMESGEEIVFADELGMWMLPIKEEPCITSYFKSAAAVFEPEEYVNAVLPVIRYDSHSSFKNKAYEKAKRAANKKQKIVLEEKIGQKG